MRLKPVEADSLSGGQLLINVEEQDKPFVIVVSEGRARMTVLPDHGETKVVTYQGKVKRVKFDEGEDF
ncbi:XtrA/YqaO family protein [Alkalihalobacillus oceani]|uniref:XtrA/YqaO family protein n=1 Tax=Halalkalibacter oceani TaxID=1653776 RepID=UPI002040D72C|nr:XtrA/YqaO family protein [Halalkalibacter oceani]MCM3759194.1 XtrA/YqaO family protein [Halalkalibacter oceani]